jgi:hypothetical protein
MLGKTFSNIICMMFLLILSDVDSDPYVWKQNK